jgi:catechol 2,3-dioxygenase-like lactoylglutathione lyase family enzyme
MMSIDHVQLGMRPGEEQKARDFYANVLGMREVVKPDPLVASGGVWFTQGAVELHLGIEVDLKPPLKAHTAIRVGQVTELASRCEMAGHKPLFDARYPGRRRFFVHDPFGNRLEFFEVEGA